MTRTKMILATAVVGYGLANSAWAEQIPNQEKPVAESPYMFIDANVDDIVAGHSVTINVYLQDVEDLAAYQVQLATEGGLSGELALDAIQIKQLRADFVFFGDHVVAAGDRRSMRAGAVTLDGGVSLTGPAYLATFVFRATNDADGLFDIYITLGSQTLLRDSAGGTVVLDAGPGVSIAVRGDPQGQGSGDPDPMEEQNTSGAGDGTQPVEEQGTGGGVGGAPPWETRSTDAGDNAAAGPGCAGGPVDMAFILNIVFCFQGVTAPGPSTDISPCGVGNGLCNFSDIVCAVHEFQGIVPGC